MSYYWIPTYKYQLVDWLSKHFHEKESAFNNMAKKQLYAIYLRVREELK